MATRRTKTRTAKKSSRPRKPRPKRRQDVVIPVPQQSLASLEADCPVGREPSPAELQELEASVQREEQREALLGLARQYPRSDRPLVKPLTDALRCVTGLKPVQARVVAQSLKGFADNAQDLNEILDRILRGDRDGSEIAELVMGFQRVLEQLASSTDMLGDKLVDVFDRAKGLK